MSEWVRDMVVNGRNESAATKPTRPQKTSTQSSFKRKKRKKKGKGRKISRELFALLGSDCAKAVSVVPTSKTRPYSSNISYGGQRLKNDKKWLWKAFGSSARQDGVMFYHWIRSDVDKQLVDYPYAKFNKKLDIKEANKRYTDQEYAKYLRDDEWSKAETDRLFDLIFAYDMRWHVIHDRYNESKPRTLEQLKSRFYDVARKLSRTRNSAPQSVKDARLYQYDAEYEKNRKTILNRQFLRTLGEEVEERELREELKKIDSEVSRLKKEAKRNGKEWILPSDSGSEVEMCQERDTTPFYTSLKNYKRSRRFETPPATPLSVGKRRMKKIEQVLRELGIPERPMPTQTVCEMHDRLKQDIMKVLSLQKYVARLERQNALAARDAGGASAAAAWSTSQKRKALPNSQPTYKKSRQ